MFTVGEFSKLAQVSKRLLRYYDEIGLLKPIHTDPRTGYRYYSAEQMTTLNRILVFKELGLSLEQVQRILQENISPDEIQGMLTMKKAEIEKNLEAELQRVRQIEARLDSIRSVEENQDINVVMKEVPAQKVLRMRTVIEDFESGLVTFNYLNTKLPRKNTYGMLYCICHDDAFVEENLDMEFGRYISVDDHDSVNITDDLTLELGELPAVETMATLVVIGDLHVIHAGYSQIGHWIDKHNYRTAGAIRELTLQFPEAPDGSDLVTEIQVPVERVTTTFPHHSDSIQTT